MDPECTFLRLDLLIHNGNFRARQSHKPSPKVFWNTNIVVQGYYSGQFSGRYGGAVYWTGHPWVLLLVLLLVPAGIPLCTDRLPIGLRQLNTLKTLSIHFCPKLRSLPDELQQLTNLQKLFIVGCRHLKESCHMEKGQDWHKIAHVPYIKVDGQIQSNWVQMQDLFY